MCGITGILEIGKCRESLLSDIKLMNNVLQHRGPDDEGVWVDDIHPIGLGHRRLSILELSESGHQPMTSLCGRYHIVFNGEIYNHIELRNLLSNSAIFSRIRWNGNSDTETLLACISTWGVRRTLENVRGMFAFALWDKEEASLTLARDRIGEKPLYYGIQNNFFIFASELKAVCAYPLFKKEIDWNAAGLFLKFNYIPAPLSIYRGVFKLLPGSFVTITQEDISRNKLPTPQCYWALSQISKDGECSPIKVSFEDAIEELDWKIQNAVKEQSIADVPVGAFLSGGIDSSLVVAMMKKETRTRVTTFSIGMPDDHLDESKHAQSVARYLGTEHLSHTISGRDVLEIIPKLHTIWDEPFGDSSQLATYMVSKLASEKVKVVLSGDGGDEFFMGYPRYYIQQRIWYWRQMKMIPWNEIFKLIEKSLGNSHLMKYVNKGKTILGAWSNETHQELANYFADTYRGGELPIFKQVGKLPQKYPNLNNAAATSALIDACTYLPDDILVKVDRAAMAYSLETRAPLLDHRVVEFASKLPLSYKIGSGCNKRILREVLYKYVPKQLIDRPKMGFSVPIGHWLQNELRDWVDEIINSIDHDSGFFDKKSVLRIWSNHMSGRIEESQKLWSILMLQSKIKNG